MMGTKIFIGVMLIIYVLFMLSVFAPMKSRNRFWIVIHKIRAVMDMFSYWFFNLCAISVLIYMAWFAVHYMI